MFGCGTSASSLELFCKDRFSGKCIPFRKFRKIAQLACVTSNMTGLGEGWWRDKDTPLKSQLVGRRMPRTIQVLFPLETLIREGVPNVWIKEGRRKGDLTRQGWFVYYWRSFVILEFPIMLESSWHIRWGERQVRVLICLAMIITLMKWSISATTSTRPYLRPGGFNLYAF